MQLLQIYLFYLLIQITKFCLREAQDLEGEFLLQLKFYDMTYALCYDEPRVSIVESNLTERALHEC